MPTPAPSRRSWRRTLGFLLVMLGVCGIVVICQGLVFRIAYDSPFSVPGLFVISLLSVGMLFLGWRLFVSPLLSVILLVGMVLCFHGIGLALPPFREPGLSRFGI